MRYRELLAEPHLSHANDEYERTCDRLNKNPPFYALWNGPRSLEQLATVLGRLAEYDVMYRQWSNTAHARDPPRQLREADGQPAFERLRSGEKLDGTYLHSINFGLTAIRLLLGHYRPDELRTFYSQWYTEKIRPGYMRLDRDT